jgi:hypothetical protein
VRPRWDIDERGRGIASADVYLGHADALRAAMAEPDWVAEDPDLHLLPHVRRFCEASEVLRLDGWSIADGVLVLDLTALGVDSWGERREAVHALIGTFAEPATLVRELAQDHDFVVVTGVLEGDSVFAPHGHTVRLRVGGGPAAK